MIGKKKVLGKKYKSGKKALKIVIKDLSIILIVEILLQKDFVDI